MALDPWIAALGMTMMFMAPKLGYYDITPATIWFCIHLWLATIDWSFYGGNDGLVMLTHAKKNKLSGGLRAEDKCSKIDNNGL